MKTGMPAYYRCEICHFSYRFRRLWWARLLGHPITAACLFTALMLAAAALFGSVPLVQSFVPSLKTHGSLVSAALHFTNGFLLLGFLGFVFWLAAHCRGWGLPPCDGLCFYGACGDCGQLASCAGAGGEACGAVMLVVLVPLALMGLMYVTAALYGALYKAVQERLRWAEHMVENVGSEPRRAGSGSGGRGGGGPAGGRRGGGDGAGGGGGAAGSRNGGETGAAAGASKGSASSGSGASGRVAVPAATAPPEKECMV